MVAKRKRPRYIWGIALLIALLGLTGCGDKGEGPPSPEVVAPRELVQSPPGGVSQTTEPKADVEALLSDLQSKIRSLSSYRATFEIVFTEGETTYGTIAFVRPDRLRMEMCMGKDERAKQYLYSDGLTLWQYLPYFKMASKVDLAALREEFPETIKELVGEQADIEGVLGKIDKGSIEYLGIEDLDGEEVCVFQGDVTQEEDAEVARVKAWVSRVDGLQRRIEAYSLDGELIYQQRLKDVLVNIEIPDQEFRFAVPEGTAIIDVTQEQREKLQGGIVEETIPGDS